MAYHADLSNVPCLTSIRTQSNKEKEAHKEYNKALKNVIKLIGHSNTTNNLELDRVGKKMFHRKYKGTFPKDMIPILKKGDSCILNLDSSKDKGSHWCALIKHSNGRVPLFYDSFGRDYKELGFKSKQWENADISDREQISKLLGDNKEEIDCGQRSLAFIKVYYDSGYEKAKLI